MVAVRHNPNDRLNVLLSESAGGWADQLPQLLEPQGVRTIRTRDVREAMDVIEREPVHVAVVDVALPMDRDAAPESPRRRFEQRHRVPGGIKLIEIIRRVDPTPPTVVIRGRLFDPRVDDRLLREALSLDVFSVLDEPVGLEQMLAVLRRLMERYYGGRWPRREDGPSPA